MNRCLRAFPNLNKTLKRFKHSNVNDKIRNIGILAHIDAGKTTTTERMLFYSGKIRSPGEVHHGNTVTDCLSQERERGITICSAAVSFSWKENKINLLDTPGHIDFTMEVEQSLSAVDGAVVILDGSAGVEAQTMTVWGQSDRYKIPRLVFVNKMDRNDADFNSCLDDLITKLNVTPVAVQCPILTKTGNLGGIVDLVSLQKMVWDTSNTGQTYKVIPLSDDELKVYYNKQIELIDGISSLDDELAEKIISSGEMSNISKDLIMGALRRCTLSGKVVPVFLGSAYKNQGVQPLIDGVIDYLPAPNERNIVFDCFADDFVGKVFKVTHDKQRGPLSLIRVLRGSLKKGAKVVTAKGGNETIQRIYEPLADEYREVNALAAGDVGVCAGLKTTVTGDLLVNNLSSLKGAQKKLQKRIRTLVDKSETAENDDDVEHLLNTLSPNPTVPDAVYFCSIEPPSLSFQQPLDNALKQLQREDPSLRVKYDETTAQTVLGGMGELHLDIIKSRILTEYKIDAELGPLQIAYKECVNETVRDTVSVEKDIAGTKQSVSIELSVKRRKQNQSEIFRLDTSPEAHNILSGLRPKYISLTRKGAVSALERGPKVGGEVIETQIILHSLVIGRGTADSFIMSIAFQCVQKLLLQSGCKLLEPVMSISINAPSEIVSSILVDLGRRRAQILDVKQKGEHNKTIDVLAPLAELENYSSVLRSISSGAASVSMQPNGYSEMALYDEERAIRQSQGLE